MRGYEEWAEESEVIIKLIICWPEVLHSPQDASSGESRREAGVITTILDNCGDVVYGVNSGQDNRQKWVSNTSLALFGPLKISIPARPLIPSPQPLTWSPPALRCYKNLL